jgi:hypothetical protein
MGASTLRAVLPNRIFFTITARPHLSFCHHFSVRLFARFAPLRDAISNLRTISRKVYQNMPNHAAHAISATEFPGRQTVNLMSNRVKPVPKVPDLALVARAKVILPNLKRQRAIRTRAIVYASSFEVFLSLRSLVFLGVVKQTSRKTP